MKYPKLKDHVLEHVSLNVKDIENVLTLWSLHSMSASKISDKQDFNLIITSHTVCKILPLLGFEDNRPWASLSHIREEVKNTLIRDGYGYPNNELQIENRSLKREIDHQKWLNSQLQSQLARKCWLF